MKQILIALIITAVSLGASGRLLAQDQPSICKAALDLEKETNKTLPRKIDEITSLVQLSVNCDAKTIKYTKQIHTDPTKRARGWQERKQRQHTQLHSNRVGAASTQGWTAMDVLFDDNWKHIITLKTTPQDCERP